MCKDKITWTPIESSNIKSVAFKPSDDSDQGTLMVRFNGGAEYHYFNVPIWMFNDLIDATLPISKGAYFYSMIKKGGYIFEKQGE